MTLTLYRRPLTLEQVPLPEGYTHAMLDPERKRRQRLAHQGLVREVLEKRLRINMRAKEDAGYRRHVLELCRRDPEFFCDHFVWTYDDREGFDKPLVLYDFQREKIVKPYLDMVSTEIHHRWTGCVEKSRGVGFTWVSLMLRLHRWSYVDNWSVLIGSVFEKDVDDGGQDATQQSLFGKIRYMLAHLPKWMQQDLYGPWIRKKEYNKDSLIKHPLKPLNIIAGKQFSAMFGRSQRFREVLGDEIAWAEKFQNADASLKNTTDLFDGGSTPRGKDTFHYQLMRGDLRVVRRTLHWSEHPDKDLDWYNLQREHMTDETIAQELDINYEGSAGHRVLPEVTEATHFVKPADAECIVIDGRVDRTLYSPHLPLHVVIDPGISDPTAVVWIQPDVKRHLWIVVDFVQATDRTIDWLVPFVLGEMKLETYRGEPWPHTYNDIEVGIVKRHSHWKAPEEVFGDSYGSHRSLAEERSPYDVLGEYGIEVCPISIGSNLQAISYLQVWMRRVKISDHLRFQRNGAPGSTPTFSEVLSQWRYKPQGEVPREKQQILHDIYCHGGDCLKMYAQLQDIESDRTPVAAGRVIKGRPSSYSVPHPYRARR